MNDVWNLDPLYQGFEDPAFEADLEKLKTVVAAMGTLAGSLAQAQPMDALKEGIRLQEDATVLLYKLYGYASLRQSADTKDSAAGSQIGRIMAIYSGFAAPVAAYKSWATSLPNLMELVQSDEDLKVYTFLFQNMEDSSRYLLPGGSRNVRNK